MKFSSLNKQRLSALLVLFGIGLNGLARPILAEDSTSSSSSSDPTADAQKLIQSLQSQNQQAAQQPPAANQDRSEDGKSASDAGQAGAAAASAMAMMMMLMAQQEKNPESKKMMEMMSMMELAQAAQQAAQAQQNKDNSSKNKDSSVQAPQMGSLQPSSLQTPDRQTDLPSLDSLKDTSQDTTTDTQEPLSIPTADVPQTPAVTAKPNFANEPDSSPAKTAEEVAKAGTGTKALGQIDNSSVSYNKDAPRTDKVFAGQSSSSPLARMGADPSATPTPASTSPATAAVAESHPRTEVSEAANAETGGGAEGKSGSSLDSMLSQLMGGGSPEAGAGLGLGAEIMHLPGGAESGNEGPSQNIFEYATTRYQKAAYDEGRVHLRPQVANSSIAAAKLAE